MLDCIIIGGGAAGLFAAAHMPSSLKVAVIEHTSWGKKLSITGKGRCNVTNACDRETFFANIRTNPRFMYSAYSAFSNLDTVNFFEAHGVKLKTERGNRIFPESDKAADIVSTLIRAVKARGTLMLKGSVTGIKLDSADAVNDNFDAAYTVITEEKHYKARTVLIATGGMSYPVTGSDGSGYKLAASLGHTVIPPRPSLVPIEMVENKLCSSMTGLSLKNTAVKLTRAGKHIYEDFGELMFTPYGMTGPVILSMSAFCQGGDTVTLDLKPALSEKQLDTRLLSDFSKNINRNFSNSLDDLLPSKMISPFVALTGIDPFFKVNMITKEQRRSIVTLLKNMSFIVAGLRPIAEAIITSGGISVKEIDPKTMQSRINPGLFFAGEIIDVDAYTGGFNLQIAFSTAYTAAVNISKIINPVSE